MNNDRALLKEILKDARKIEFLADCAFKALDKDCNGYVEKDEVEEMMRSISTNLNLDPPTDEEITEIFNHFDENADGKLSVEDFVILIKTILELAATNQIDSFEY